MPPHAVKGTGGEGRRWFQTFCRNSGRNGSVEEAERRWVINSRCTPSVSSSLSWTFRESGERKENSLLLTNSILKMYFN